MFGTERPVHLQVGKTGQKMCVDKKTFTAQILLLFFCSLCFYCEILDSSPYYT